MHPRSSLFVSPGCLWKCDFYYYWYYYCMPPAILTTLKCCVWIAAVCVRVCVRECVNGVMQTVGKEKGNEKWFYWVYSLEISCIYMTNLCKEWCCNSELKAKRMGFQGRVWGYLFIIVLYVLQGLLERWKTFIGFSFFCLSVRGAV